MNDILNVLYEAARVHNASPELLAHHEEMMNEKRFAKKVDYAGDLLPANLRPAGAALPHAASSAFSHRFAPFFGRPPFLAHLLNVAGSYFFARAVSTPACRLRG